MQRRPSIGWLTLASLLATSAQGAGDVRPGAYCPLPKPGETPACMLPAKQAYGEFFAALDADGAVEHLRSHEGKPVTGTGPGYAGCPQSPAA